jgi:hypothetical protein
MEQGDSADTRVRSRMPASCGLGFTVSPDRSHLASELSVQTMVSLVRFGTTVSANVSRNMCFLKPVRFGQLLDQVMVPKVPIGNAAGTFVSKSRT